MQIPGTGARKYRQFMLEALKQAENAFLKEEIPVGAVIEKNGVILGRGFNQVESLRDPSAHAEMLAITAACDTVGGKFLTGATLYVTLEPCAMCTGALLLSRIETIVFAASEPKTGCCGSLYHLAADPRFNHRINVIGGIMEEESERLLKRFFREMRQPDAG